MFSLFYGSLALAGVVYVGADHANILSLDTRSLELFPVMTGPTAAYAGMALDPANQTLWIYDPSGGWAVNQLWAVDLPSLTMTNFGRQGLALSSAMAFDPNARTLYAFEESPTTQLFRMPGAVPSGDPGFDVDGADWSDFLGGMLLYSVWPDGFYLYAPGGVPALLSPLPPEFVTNYQVETAYDSDTKLIWTFDTFGDIWAVEPVNFTVVAYLYHPPWLSGGAGSIDDVPAQTPELLVTGECPGTVYVTVVDATPGSHVRIASATRRGSRTIPGGPCGGQRSALGNPTPRFDLIASSAGIASTRVTATAGMCGQVALQALDEGSCQLTSARLMP
jgi:hypothetical protein